MSWCDEHGTDGGCSECADEQWEKEVKGLALKVKRLEEVVWEAYSLGVGHGHPSTTASTTIKEWCEFVDNNLSK